MEDTFIAMVQAQPSVVALIGSGANARLFPVRLPQKPTYPAMTYQVVSAVRDYTQQGPDGVVRFRIQCNLYGATYAEAKALRDALEISTSGLNNVAYGSPPVYVKGVFWTNERDWYEQALDQTPAGGPYRKSVDLMVTMDHPA